MTKRAVVRRSSAFSRAPDRRHQPPGECGRAPGRLVSVERASRLFGRSDDIEKQARRLFNNSAASISKHALTGVTPVMAFRLSNPRQLPHSRCQRGPDPERQHPAE